MASSLEGLCVALISVGSRWSICCGSGAAVGHKSHQLGKRAVCRAEECKLLGTHEASLHLFVTISVCIKDCQGAMGITSLLLSECHGNSAFGYL